MTEWKVQKFGISQSKTLETFLNASSLEDWVVHSVQVSDSHVVVILKKERL